jgi:hypothetical protein
MKDVSRMRGYLTKNFANCGEADAALDCPCRTVQTSRVARPAEIVPSVIEKNTKAPLLMQSPRYL